MGLQELEPGAYTNHEAVQGVLADRCLHTAVLDACGAKCIERNTCWLTSLATQVYAALEGISADHLWSLLALLSVQKAVSSAAELELEAVQIELADCLSMLQQFSVDDNIT